MVPSNGKGLRDIDYNPEYFAKQGIIVGYENPAFEAPVDFFKDESGPIICEGSSTPTISIGEIGKDYDSAFQESSILVSSSI